LASRRYSLRRGTHSLRDSGTRPVSALRAPGRRPSRNPRRIRNPRARVHGESGAGVSSKRVSDHVLMAGAWWVESG
jgi:hypothetical protein